MTGHFAHAEASSESDLARPGRGRARSSGSVSESSGGGCCRQRRPELRQQCLRTPAGAALGTGHCGPSFSTSSLSPWTTRSPRFTCVSGRVASFRRLLISPKKLASSWSWRPIPHRPSARIMWPSARRSSGRTGSDVVPRNWSEFDRGERRRPLAGGAGGLEECQLTCSGGEGNGGMPPVFWGQEAGETSCGPQAARRRR